MRELLALLLLTGTASAQSIAPSPQGLTAQFSASCAASTCATWALGTATSVTVSVTGVGSWTGTFKASSDGGNTYFTATVINLADRTTTTTVTDTQDGQYAIVNSGITHLQFRLTTWASGGANVWAIRGYGSPMALPFSSGSPVPASGGGTGFSSYAVGDMLTADTTTTLSKLADVAVGSVLVSGGVGVVPAWSATPSVTSLTAAASGTCATPRLNFTGNTNTGVGWLASNNAAGCAGGATIFDWNASRVLFAQPVQLSITSDTAYTSFLSTNLSAGTSAFSLFKSVNDNSKLLQFGMVGSGNTVGGIYVADGSIIEGNGTGGISLAASHASGTLRLYTGTTARLTIGTTGISTFSGTVVSPILQGSGTGTSVANVAANSCGTSAASIAGNQISGVITVGATAGTQCRVTFTTAAPTARDCTVTDSTTTIATRATVVDTTNTDFLGAFVAGDKITFICMVR